MPNPSGHRTLTRVVERSKARDRWMNKRLKQFNKRRSMRRYLARAKRKWMKPNELLSIPDALLSSLEYHFHALIMERAGSLVRARSSELPHLRDLIEAGNSSGQYSIPGMYGSFHFMLRNAGRSTVLTCESYSRVVHGSGQRHVITQQGSKLVEDRYM